MARALRRDEPAGARAALPRPDRRLDADRAAAREQRRARRDPGAVGGLRRRAVAAHELVRRGARAADASMRRRSRCARSRSSPHETGVDEHGRSARRLLLRRGAHRRARGACARADRADRRARRRGRGDRGRASSRTRSRRRRSSGQRRSSAASGRSSASTRSPRRASERIELHRLDPEAERRQVERTAPVRAERDADEAAARARRRARERRAATRTCCRRCATALARALHGRRDLRRCCARSGAIYDALARAPEVRILLVSQMYPGPADPDLGAFVAQLERALAERGHEIDLRRARPARAAGSTATSSCAASARRALDPTSCGRTSSSRRA